MMPERGVVEGTVAVPLHPDGFAWSEEQDFILRSVETAILGDDRPTLCRFVAEAVAGQERRPCLRPCCCALVASVRIGVWPRRRSAAISALLKEILTRLKDAGFHGAQIIGDSNGVQAAGRCPRG